ncbi:NHL domain-containing protein [Quillaja saponaria]|uniref:NHL domain-containing protein n=1 Tax=Quillaja saponaria TaxID=32244 RepID=A0AAD7LI02_QUISA|nr:NHL domain-containing protein [Quillaja saponaria]
MATPHSQPQSQPRENSQLEEHGQLDYAEEYYNQDMGSPVSCGCFRGSCFSYFCQSNVRHGYVLHQHEEQDHAKENWLVKKLNKVKVFSEVLGGPKWKNFIRRFSVNDGIGKKRKMQFQYDPKSYALNFDDGIRSREVEIEGMRVDFSARFADPLGINKVDLGG